MIIVNYLESMCLRVCARAYQILSSFLPYTVTLVAWVKIGAITVVQKPAGGFAVGWHGR